MSSVNHKRLKAEATVYVDNVDCFLTMSAVTKRRSSTTAQYVQPLIGNCRQDATELIFELVNTNTVAVLKMR